MFRISVCKQLDAFEHVLLWQWRRERHLGFQRAEELLCVGDVTDAVHVRVFHLGRALALRRARQDRA